MSKTVAVHPTVGPSAASKRALSVVGVLGLIPVAVGAIIAALNGQLVFIVPLSVFAVGFQVALHRLKSREIVVGPDGLTVKIWPGSHFMGWAEVERVWFGVQKGQRTGPAANLRFIEVVDRSGAKAVFSEHDEGFAELARAILDHAGLKIEDEAVLATLSAWASSDAPPQGATIA